MKAIFGFLLIFSMNYLVICAQQPQKFFKAYVIKNSNDTIHGKVRRFYEGITSCQYVKFWAEDGNKTTFTTKDIKEFYLQGLKFERIELKTPPCSTCDNTAFLVAQIEGPMKLYRYQHTKMTVSLMSSGLNSKCIVYYYIQKQNDKSALLAYKENCDMSILQITSQANNFDDFCNYFSDSPLIKNKIVNKEYTRKDIETIVNEYNSSK